MEPPRDGEGDRAQRGGGVSPFGAPRETVLRARRERRSGNPAEVRLWQALRRRPGGLKFRRQHPLGRYCLDFACLEARLAIEVDGEVHARGDRPDRDAVRDGVADGFGFATLRIAARDVFQELDAVVAMIVAACRERAPLHHPAAPDGPPPRTGEVFRR